MTAQGDFRAPSAIRFEGEPLPAWLAADFAALRGLRIGDGPDAFPVRLDRAPVSGPAGAYELELRQDGARLAAADSAGLGYAARTLEQLIAYHPGRWPIIHIEDSPAFRKRGFMADLGRSVWSLPMLKRTVRILQRLKMNQLHLHLYDDELCALRFEGLPFGSDNPYALSLADLGELVAYAAERHVEIVPELEAWGHVGSLIYHRPDLGGGVGMYDGKSFRIGRDVYAVVREMVLQVAAVLPNRATIHLGLDEARWYAADDLPPGYTPADMVGAYHGLLRDIGRELGKELTLRVWADHAGRPIPPEIAGEVIVEPWCYWGSLEDKMLGDLERYSGPGKPPWMAGAGVSAAQPRGAFHATRFWATRAADSPNCEGVNITFWGWNDLDAKMESLFAGAHYLWNPRAEAAWSAEENYEAFDRLVYPILCGWQAAFPDADPDAIRADRGPVVFFGHYHFGGRHGQPVSPTATLAGTYAALGHDYLHEHEIGQETET